MDNLTITDYLKAIDYGYMSWEERWWAIWKNILNVMINS
jgi:hypothetical protein